MRSESSLEKRPIRVGLVVSSEFSGGGEQYLYRLYSRLVKDGRVSVELVGSLPQWPADLGTVISVGRSPKLTRRRTLVSQIWRLLSPMLKSLRLARANHYDIVHVQYFKEKLTLPFFLRRTGILWTEHGPLPENFPPGGLGLLKLQSRHCSVVAVSHGVASSLRDEGIRSLVIPNPLPAVDSVFDAEDPSEAVETKLLFAGRVHRSKRLDLLIDAARLNPALQVIIAGDGPDREYFEAISPANVVYLGQVTPILPLVAKCSAVVITSGRAAREGSPMIMLEARRLGIPVLVAEDCHAASEAVELGCTTFEPSGRALAAAASDPASLRRSELSREILEQRSEEAWADAHFQVMKGLLRNRTRD